jgi:hypothetical protein
MHAIPVEILKIFKPQSEVYWVFGCHPVDILRAARLTDLKSRGKLLPRRHRVDKQQMDVLEFGICPGMISQRGIVSI